MIKWRKGFLASIKSTAILVTAWELKMIDIHAAHTLKKVVVLQSVQYNLCNKTLDRTWTFLGWYQNDAEFQKKISSHLGRSVPDEFVVNLYVIYLKGE